MIAHVAGEVVEVGLTSAVLDVHGVGLELLCTPRTLAGLRVGETGRLAASMVVREDSMTLFGFADSEERRLFELLQSASGVGPKVAQAMLAVHAPDDVRTAIAGEDTKALTKVPGIGPKGAQRIILELKDKVGQVAVPGRPAAPAAAEPWREQVHAGLVGLGWSAKEADKAVDAVAEDPNANHTDGPADVGALLRAALQTLSRA